MTDSGDISTGSTSTASSAIATLGVVALDTRDPRGLAAFYGALLGAPVASDEDHWVQLAPTGGVALAFQHAPGHVPPRWPGDEHPQQIHLDFDVPDIAAAEPRVLALGARKHEIQPGGASFQVYLDPAGHPFCLVRG
ncbi:MAG TPA: VOC family protein [Pseudonocardia sp.]|nr:VOC family protein [Pseudonocardia sp.]